MGALRDELGALGDEGRGSILAAIAVPWGLLVGSRMALPVLLPSIRQTFGLSLTVAGALVTILWLAGAVGQLPSGVLADRYREVAIMAAGILAVVLALGLIVLLPAAPVLFLGVILWGLGMSLYPIARITLLAEVFPDRLGSALGVTMATGDLGQTVIPPVAGTLAAWYAWEAGLAFVIPPLGIGAFALWLVVSPVTTGDARGTPMSTATLGLVWAELRRPLMIFMAAILFLYIFLWQAFTAFYPTYLVVEKGLSDQVAGIVFGVFFAAGAVVKPLAGMAYDRIGVRWSLITILGAPALALFVLPWMEGLLSLVAVTAVISSMLGTGAITQSFIAEQFAADIQGTGLGVFRTGTAVLGSAGPALFGLIADRGFFDEGYILLAGMLCLVVLLTFKLPGED